jgi:hypothetical protein
MKKNNVTCQKHDLSCWIGCSFLLLNSMQAREGGWHPDARPTQILHARHRLASSASQATRSTVWPTWLPPPLAGRRQKSSRTPQLPRASRGETESRYFLTGSNSHAAASWRLTGTGPEQSPNRKREPCNSSRTQKLTILHSWIWWVTSVRVTKHHV